MSEASIFAAAIVIVKDSIKTGTLEPAAPALADAYKRAKADCRAKPPKCKCSAERGGIWAVEYDGKLYQFQHNNNLSLHLWYSNIEKVKAEQMKMVRWYCLGCGTLQMP